MNQMRLDSQPFYNPNLDRIEPSPIREMTQRARQKPDCQMLTIGEPDFDTPACISEAAWRGIQAGHTHYPPFEGRYDLRQAIAAYESRQHGLDYDPDEVLVTTGATGAIYTTLMGLLRPGDEVIIPLPAFGYYGAVTRLLGADVVALQTQDRGYQIDPDRLAAAVSDKTRLMVLTSPNNPTGAILDPQSLEVVAECALKHGFYLLCDEVYRDLVYEAGATYLSNDQRLREQLIVIQSFSKPWAMTGWRIGYLMADRPLRNRLALVHQHLVTSVANFTQDAAIQALQTDITPFREAYRRRRDRMVKRLRQMGFSVEAPSGAFYIFLDLTPIWQGRSEAFANRLLEDYGLALVPGSAFGVDTAVRISYCYSDEAIERGMDRLEQMVKQLKREASPR